MSPGVPTAPGDVSPDPEPAPHLPLIGKSVVIQRTDGTEKSYSGLVDYIKSYVDQGLITDLDDLVNNYGHLVGELFFNWIRTGQPGCLFAMQLAKKPRENRWLPIVRTGALSEGPGLGDSLNAALDAAENTHEAAAVIFPDIATPTEIVELVNLLCSAPSGRWYRTNDGIDPADGLALIGLRWILKSNTSVNHVLGFAPIATMPATRRSPFTALFLRILEEKRTPVRREDGRVQVHLADLDSTLPTQASHDRVLEQTKIARALNVEQNLTAVARARVTFAVPPHEARLLCSAKRVRVEDGEPAH